MDPGIALATLSANRTHRARATLQQRRRTDGAIGDPPGVAPSITPRVQPETLSEVTDLLGHLRLLLRHLMRYQKGWETVAADRSVPGEAGGTGSPAEICFDLLSRAPEEIAADSRQIERLYSSVSALAATTAPATISSIAITSAFLREEMRPSLPLEAQSAARRLRHWALAVVLLAFAFFLLTILVLVYVDRGRRELQQLEHARSEFQLVLGVIHQSRDPDLLANCLSAVAVEATADLRGRPGAQPLCDRLQEARYRLRIARIDLEAWNTLWNQLSFMPPERPTQEPQDRLQPALSETQWGASELHASVNMAGLTGFVLPMLLGLLGAFTYVYRNIDSKIRAATLSSGDGAHATLRILLGMMLGGLLGVIWTNGQPIELEGVTLSLAALAFFVGYGVEVVFQILDRIIARTISGSRGRNVNTGAVRLATLVDVNAVAECAMSRPVLLSGDLVPYPKG